MVGGGSGGGRVSKVRIVWVMSTRVADPISTAADQRTPGRHNRRDVVFDLTLSPASFLPRRVLYSPPVCVIGCVIVVVVVVCLPSGRTTVPFFCCPLRALLSQSGRFAVTSRN